MRMRLSRLPSPSTRFRRLVSAFLAVAALHLLACVAHADALPSPGRPDFDDTPLPMPDEPEEMAAIGVMALLGLVVLVKLRRRTA